MADPFTALGVASNIIQLVDYTWKLFSSAQAIYNSASGSSESHAAAELIARDVSRLSTAVVVSHVQSEELRALAAESKRVAEGLLGVFGKLKAKGPGTRLGSLKVALKDIWARDEIHNLQRSLSELQTQITAHVQWLMGDQISEISVAVRNLMGTNTLLQLDMKKLIGMQRSMTDIVEATGSIELHDQKRQSERFDGVQSTHLNSLSLALAGLGAQGSEITSEQGLLRSLYFNMIQTRHQKIETAHTNTYTWIFRNSLPDSTKRIRFVEWLARENTIFWVQGKPGSGKSTLMKFICSSPKTRDLLGRWAELNFTNLSQDDGFESLEPTEEQIRRAYEYDNEEVDEERAQQLRRRLDRETRQRYEAKLIRNYKGLSADRTARPTGAELAQLVMAKYFFWNAGSKLQKSLEGLLRSFLFEVLRQCPELVDHVHMMRLRYRGLDEDQLDHSSVTAAWGVDELTATLQEVIGVRVSASFCFFIDGLDEYQEEGNHTFGYLVDTLNQISSSPNAKVCVSSRPWTVFLDAFSTNFPYCLTLEDLTRGDIHRFVSDKFEKHTQYDRLKNHNPSYANLIDEVVRRARGVFLWVYLVVRELLDGLTYNDTVETMLSRLDRFPEDLEDFFQHMIDCIPAVYRHQAARTFMVTMAANEPLLLTLHCFLDEIETDPEFPIKRPQMPFSFDELAFKHERMRRQLEGRSKGLLEIASGREATTPYFIPRVDFLHRTVRDFLQSSTPVQSLLMHGSESESSVWVLVCRGVLAQIRYAPFNMTLCDARDSFRNHIETEWLLRFLNEFVFFAKKALQDLANKATIQKLQGQVESACEMLKERLHLGDGPNLLLGPACHHGMLELLQQSGYNWADFPKHDAQQQHPPPLLRYALTLDSITGQLYPEVVAYLLQHGADPNRAWHGASHFSDFLSLINRGELSAEQTGVLDVLGYLLAHGADLSVSVQELGQVDSTLAATAIIEKFFLPEQVSWLYTRLPRNTSSGGVRGTRSSLLGQDGVSGNVSGSKSNYRHRMKRFLGRRAP